METPEKHECASVSDGSLNQLLVLVLMTTLTFLTVRVLQTETGFVSLCHFGTVGVEQVIVGENVHAVVMSVEENAA